jgi:hypothetical protein
MLAWQYWGRILWVPVLTSIVHTDLFASVLAMATSWRAAGKVAFDLHAHAYLLITLGRALFGKGWQMEVVEHARRWEVIWGWAIVVAGGQLRVGMNIFGMKVGFGLVGQA